MTCGLVPLLNTFFLIGAGLVVSTLAATLEVLPPEAPAPTFNPVEVGGCPTLRVFVSAAMELRTLFFTRSGDFKCREFPIP